MQTMGLIVQTKIWNVNDSSKSYKCIISNCVQVFVFNKFGTVNSFPPPGNLLYFQLIWELVEHIFEVSLISIFFFFVTEQI